MFVVFIEISGTMNLSVNQMILMLLFYVRQTWKV